MVWAGVSAAGKRSRGVPGRRVHRAGSDDGGSGSHHKARYANRTALQGRVKLPIRAHFDDAVPGIYGEYQMAAQMGNDHIDAGAGNDIVVTRGGNDVVDGGAGDDILIDTHSGYEARFASNTSYHYSCLRVPGMQCESEIIQCANTAPNFLHSSARRMVREAGRQR